MVEGSQIDWAGHDNDIVGAMSEMKDFEKRIKQRSHLPKGQTYACRCHGRSYHRRIDDRRE